MAVKGIYYDFVHENLIFFVLLVVKFHDEEE